MSMSTSWLQVATIFSFQDPPKSTHNGILLGYHVAWRYAGLAGTFTTKTVTPATNRKLKIDGLILNSPYEIKVRMFNNAGAGPYSDVLDAKTKEGGKCFVT